MKRGPEGVQFTVPYEIAVVRPLRQTTLAQREQALQAAHYNTELIPQDLIYLDLSTDSGVSAMSTAQLATLTGVQALEPGMGMASEGSKCFQLLAEEFRRIFGFPYVVVTTQGRAAERLWSKLHIKPGGVVPGNMLFPSTRTHIEINGGKVLDVIGEAAHDLDSDELFKGDVDLAKLEAGFKEHGDKISCVYVELSVNACGGHPVSLANLSRVRELTAAHNVPLFLDTCRILENSYLIKQREAGYENRSIREIVRETCDLADAVTMSALKDLLVPAGGLIGTRDKTNYQRAYMQGFLDGTQPPGSVLEMIASALKEIVSTDAYIASRVEQVHYLWRRLKDGVPLVHPTGGHAVFIDVKKFLPGIPSEYHPTEALAAFVYHMSGIRLTKGPPPAPSQTARGTELLRLALPARKYIQGHLDDVTEALLYAYAHRNEIKGLMRMETPGRSKYEPAYFTKA